MVEKSNELGDSESVDRDNSLENEDALDQSTLQGDSTSPDKDKQSGARENGELDFDRAPISEEQDQSPQEHKLPPWLWEFDSKPVEAEYLEPQEDETIPEWLNVNPEDTNKEQEDKDADTPPEVPDWLKPEAGKPPKEAKKPDPDDIPLWIAESAPDVSPSEPESEEIPEWISDAPEAKPGMPPPQVQKHQKGTDELREWLREEREEDLQMESGIVDKAGIPEKEIDADRAEKPEPDAPLEEIISWLKESEDHKTSDGSSEQKNIPTREDIDEWDFEAMDAAYKAAIAKRLEEARQEIKESGELTELIEEEPGFLTRLIKRLRGEPIIPSPETIQHEESDEILTASEIDQPELAPETHKITPEADLEIEDGDQYLAALETTDDIISDADKIGRSIPQTEDKENALESTIIPDDEIEDEQPAETESKDKIKLGLLGLLLAKLRRRDKKPLQEEELEDQEIKRRLKGVDPEGHEIVEGEEVLPSGRLPTPTDAPSEIVDDEDRRRPGDEDSDFVYAIKPGLGAESAYEIPTKQQPGLSEEELDEDEKERRRLASKLASTFLAGAATRKILEDEKKPDQSELDSREGDRYLEGSVAPDGTFRPPKAEDDSLEKPTTSDLLPKHPGIVESDLDQSAPEGSGIDEDSQDFNDELADKIARRFYWGADTSELVEERLPTEPPDQQAADPESWQIEPDEYLDQVDSRKPSSDEMIHEFLAGPETQEYAWPEMAEDAQKAIPISSFEDMRETALEEFDEEALRAEPELEETWFQRLPLVQKVLLIILVIIPVLAILLGGSLLVYNNLLPALVAANQPPPMPTVTAELDSPHPTGIILPGGWPFVLNRGTLVEGQWNPQSAEWLENTQITRWVALPYTKQLGAVIQVLEEGDQITLIMSNSDHLFYRVESVREVPTNQVTQVVENRPSLVLILSGEQSDTRWVVIATPFQPE